MVTFFPPAPGVLQIHSADSQQLLSSPTLGPARVMGCPLVAWGPPPPTPDDKSGYFLRAPPTLDSSECDAYVKPAL